MRSKKALINIVVELLLQITAILCGLIVPRLIIKTYGSSVNGLVVSIGQFLTYIVLLEAGVGGVVRAALYKLLAVGNITSISRVMKATENFFKKIALIFVIYLSVLSISIPFILRSDFDYIYTFSLILIIGVSNFFQYYFGITYQLLLQADQRQYITSVLQLITLIINTVFVLILVNLGANIHLVKLVSSIFFVFRPIILKLYVNRRYKLSRECEEDNEAISQRWDGLGHHIAFFVTNSTDIVILTMLASIKEVSVYSVYFMVVSSIKTLTITFSSSLDAAFGNMIAKEEKGKLIENFQIFEFWSFSLTTILFTSTAILILPFVSLYTKGIVDVDYHRPLFSTLMVMANAIYCIRVPYNVVVLSARHYKQTRNGAFVEAAINIFLSILLVKRFGIVGVALGTVVAMIFRTVQYVLYLSKNIIYINLKLFIKRVIVFSATAALILIVSRLIPQTEVSNYFQWFLYAVKVSVAATSATLIMGALAYFKELSGIYIIIRRLFVKRIQ